MLPVSKVFALVAAALLIGAYVPYDASAMGFSHGNNFGGNHFNGNWHGNNNWNGNWNNNWNGFRPYPRIITNGNQTLYQSVNNHSLLNQNEDQVNPPRFNAFIRNHNFFITNPFRTGPFPPFFNFNRHSPDGRVFTNGNFNNGNFNNGRVNHGWTSTPVKTRNPHSPGTYWIQWSR
jgi:hypothetical protein